MGKKLDALFHRTFKASEFVYLANLVISRMVYLGKQHRIRCQQTRSDVLQLLDLGQKDRALLRLEYLIKEQNMLDAYAMIENYLNLLMERIVILKNNKHCPDELKEAVSNLIFAASRCGELPELQKIRKIFTSRYGKELETCAVELSNNCRVSPKIVVKLSTQPPSFESKLKVLKEMAPTHHILKRFEEETPGILEKIEAEEQQEDPEAEYKASSSISVSDDLSLEEDTNNLAAKLKLDGKEKYRNAKTAAEAAFNFATHAAEAAKAAMELARTKKNDPGDRREGSKGFDFDPNKINPTGKMWIWQ